ncbi:MAG: hypothetical protein VB048_10920 [Bacteroidaceae bacterium]|nr:hypothetical protein [Bacteroidaceae bacterium]MEA5017124.1 hypothetical protein [Erysipelotrichaceae bacterium]
MIIDEKFIFSKPIKKQSESLAREILREFNLLHFANLKMCDKPDLKEFKNSIGIEVTMLSTIKDSQYVMGVYNKVLKGEIKKNDFLDKFKNVYFVYDDKNQIIGLEFELLNQIENLIMETLNKKTKKLNNKNELSYQYFDHYQLFIHIDVWNQNETKRKFINLLNDYKTQNQKSYEVVYIYDNFHHILNVFDLKNKIEDSIKFSVNKHEELYSKAKKVIR